MQALLIFFSFFCAALFYALAFFFLSFSIQKCHKSKRQLHTITKLLSVNYRFATQTYTGCLTNLETSNTKNLQHESCRSSFSLSLQCMESLFWIKEVEDIDPEIQTTQKFLGHQQIYFQYRLGVDNYVFWNSHN